MKKYLTSIVLGLLFLPLSIQAAGLLPCGEAGNPCGVCHIFLLIKNIVDIVLFPFVPIVATLLAVIGGFYIMLGGTNPQSLNRGKAILISTAVGIIIIYGAWAIVNTVLAFLGVAEFTGLNEWWVIKCE